MALDQDVQNDISITILIVGIIFQRISIPFWIDSFGNNTNGPYFILLFSSFIFTLIFGLIKLLMGFKKNITTISFKDFSKMYLIIGFICFLNGVFMVYSSPIDRTPPVLFLVLSNILIFYDMLLTKKILKYRNYLNYCAKKPIISICFMIISILVIIIGKIIYDTSNSSFKYISIFWICMTLIGYFFNHFYCVLFESYFSKIHKIIDTPFSKIKNYISMVYYVNLYQFVVMILFCWIDIIPTFGYSTHTNFLNNLSNSLYCFFGCNDCNYDTSLWGISFIIGYVITNLSITFIYYYSLKVCFFNKLLENI